MKTAIVCLCLGVVALGNAARPALLHGQTDYRIDVAQPGAVAGQRFSMHQRVRVTIANLNPFAGSYRVSVFEHGYSDSAITQFLGALGVSVPASSPQPAHVGASIAAVGSAASGIDALRGAVEERKPPCCRQTCIDRLDRLVSGFMALNGALAQLDSHDVAIRRDYAVMASESSSTATVVAALQRVVDTLTRRADRLHQGATYVADATGIRDSANALWSVVGSCGASEPVRATVALIQHAAESLAKWAAWRDTVQVRDTVALAALRGDQMQLTKLSTNTFEVGDYDDPTTVDIRVQRLPPGTFNAGVLVGQGGAAAPAPGPADTTFAAGWRTVASPRLHFGQRRRIGLSGALVFAIGPETQSYGIVYQGPGDSATIMVTRSEHTLVPLLTLTARMAAFDLRFLGTGAFDLHLGVTPSVTPRPTYFGGVGLAFADERIGLVAGLLILPVQELATGFSVRDTLAAKQTSAPVRDGRVVRWAFGVNLRPF